MSFRFPDYTGLNFTSTLHTDPRGTSTDPSRVSLAPGFTVCIIGGSRGIGRSIAEAYSMAGASQIVVTGRDADALASAASACRSASPHSSLEVITTKCEITSESSIMALGDLIQTDPRLSGKLDVVVVNPAFWGNTDVRVTEGDPAQWRTITDVDLMGACYAAHHLVPCLLAKPGGAKAFLAISGPGAWMVGGPFAHLAHCVNKLAVVRLVEHMAADFEKEGLLCATVSPGCVRTESSLKGPEEFHQFLTDDPLLCGAFLVWLTKVREETLWLSGRFLSAPWDVDELTARKQEIVDKGMLKARMVVS